MVPNRGTFCPVFTPIRHFFWLSLFSLPLCTFFGHFLSNPPSKIRPGGTPAQRASIATQCCSPAGPPSLRDGFLRGGYNKKILTNKKDFRFYHNLLLSNSDEPSRLASPKTVLLAINRLLIKLQENKDVSQHFSVGKQLFERFMKLFNLKHNSIAILKSRNIGQMKIDKAPRHRKYLRAADYLA